MCALACLAQATDMNACGAITATGYYRLTADLSISSTSCLTVTGLNAAAYVEIDCDGHSITNTGTMDGNWAINAHDNNAGIEWHHCKFYGSKTDVKVENTSNYGLDPSVYGHSNEYHNTTTAPYPAIVVINSPRPTFNNEHLYDKVVAVSGSTRPIITYITVNLANINTGEAVSMIILVDCDNSYVRYNTLTGDPSMAYCDDGIAIESTTSAGGTGGSIVSNEIRNTWDAPVEVVGKWSNLTVTDNWQYNFGVTAFGCYPRYGCSLDGLTLSRNTSVAHYTTTFPLLINGTSSTQLTNSIITDNTISYVGAVDSGATAAVNLGYTPYEFGTAYNNYIANNQFGPNTVVMLQATSPSPFTDGGGNYCLSSTTSAITCH